jgi:predicted nucleotidyltransferase
VVTDLLTTSTQLRSDDVMIVGARCRDLLQRALGYRFDLRVTSDIDLGLAVSNWSAYEELTTNLRPVGNTGIRYMVASVPADLMPFGRVEDPPGTVKPAARRETMSVWGFTEVFGAASPLPLPGGSTVRIPTVAGYAALKLAAWLDRSAYREYKDASDIAAVLSWYAESTDVQNRLYDTAHGQNILVQEDVDDQAAAARVLGEDIATVIGDTLLAELAERWPGSRGDRLYDSMTVTNAPGWHRPPDRWRELVRAMERGLGTAEAK